MKHISTISGYTLLFSVLIATLVLSVAIFILSISRKQFQLAVASRESMYAFYNAQSAIECIKSADFSQIASSTGSNHAYTKVESTGNSCNTNNSCTVPTCNGTQLIEKSWVQDPDTATVSNSTTWVYQGIPFNFTPLSSASGCAIITYNTSIDVAHNKKLTTTQARGYNTCKRESSAISGAPDNYLPDTGSASIVERASQFISNTWR